MTVLHLKGDHRFFSAKKAMIVPLIPVLLARLSEDVNRYKLWHLSLPDPQPQVTM